MLGTCCRCCCRCCCATVSSIYRLSRRRHACWKAFSTKIGQGCGYLFHRRRLVFWLSLTPPPPRPLPRRCFRLRPFYYVYYDILQSLELTDYKCGPAAQAIELFVRSATVLPKRPAVLVMDAMPDQDMCDEHRFNIVNRRNEG